MHWQPQLEYEHTSDRLHLTSNDPTKAASDRGTPPGRELVTIR
jgi:hypothetical protein